MPTRGDNARTTLRLGDGDYEVYRLKALEDRLPVATLPYSLKILLENLLRHEDGVNVTAEDIEALASWDPMAEPSKEIAFVPARVLMQDSPVCPRSWTSRRCARPWSTWEAIPSASIRSRPPSW